MGKLKDWIIDRIYKCSSCKGLVKYEDKFGEDFKKKCPLCGELTLLIQSANCGLGAVVDMSKPKTIRELGNKNYEEAKNNNTLPEIFTKKRNKIDYSILDNPGKYIQTGKKK